MIAEDAGIYRVEPRKELDSHAYASIQGQALVQNHHLVVPFSELEAVKSKGLNKARTSTTTSFSRATTSRPSRRSCPPTTGR